MLPAPAIRRCMANPLRNDIGDGIGGRVTPGACAGGCMTGIKGSFGAPVFAAQIGADGLAASILGWTSPGDGQLPVLGRTLAWNVSTLAGCLACTVFICCMGPESGIPGKATRPAGGIAIGGASAACAFGCDDRSVGADLGA